MENLGHILAEHAFFKELEPRHLEVVVGCAANVRFNAGETIFHEGEEANQFYLIREGKVALNLHTDEPEPLTIQTLGEGEILGWSWLIPPHQWRFSARTVEPTRALALDGKCLRGKCERDHDLGYEILKRFAPIITHRLQATRLQLLEIYHTYRNLVEGRDIS